MWVLNRLILKQLKPCGRFFKCSFRLLYTFLFAFVSMSHAATFKIDHQTVPSGATTVTVPIKVSDFTDTGAFQFTLILDAAVLSFKNLGDLIIAPPSRLGSGCHWKCSMALRHGSRW